MPQAFNPTMGGQSVPPEVLQAMLGLSERSSELEDLKRQLAMSEMLSKGAIEPSAGISNPYGGFAAALAKGMQGYMGGKMYNENKVGAEGFRNTQRDRRSKYFNWASQDQGAPSQSINNQDADPNVPYTITY